MSDSVVYFIRGAKTKLIKIGFSTNLDGRLQNIARETDQTCTVLMTVPGGYKEEQGFHTRFTAHRTGAKSEWFRYEGDLRDFSVARSCRCRPCRQPFQPITESERL